MKKMSRLLAVIMAIAVVMSLSVITASAADAGYYDPSLGTDYVINVDIPAGETNYVNCYVDGDGYVATLTGIAGVGFAHGEEGFTFRMDGQEYPLTLVGDPLLRGNAQITLTNNNSVDVTMKIVITSPDAGTEPSAPAGTWDDPATLVIGENTANIAASSGGYYFNWTAEEDTELTISVDASASCAAWEYQVNNKTTSTYGDWISSTAASTTSTTTVAAGDVLEICVNTVNSDPNTWWQTPAGVVVLNASLPEEPVEKFVGLGNNYVVIRENYMGMGKMMTIIAPSDGHLSLKVNAMTSLGEPLGGMAAMMSGISVYVNNVTVNTANGNDAANISNFTDGAYLPVTAGDEISIQVTAGRGVDFEIDFDLTLEDHNPSEITGTPAGCTTTGLTDGSACSVCEKVLIAQAEIPAVGHTPETDAAVPATCTATGLTEGSHCSVCKEVLVAQEEVPMAAHTPETDAAVPATCVKPGLTEGSHCSVCKEVLVAQVETPVVAHTLDKGTVTKEASCSAMGETTYACTVDGCEHTETKADIAKIAHVDENKDNICDACKADLSNANTGDASMVWFVLMTVSTMALAAVVVMKKKFAI